MVSGCIYMCVCVFMYICIYVERTNLISTPLLYQINYIVLIIEIKKVYKKETRMDDLDILSMYWYIHERTLVFIRTQVVSLASYKKFG